MECRVRCSRVNFKFLGWPRPAEVNLTTPLEALEDQEQLNRQDRVDDEVAVSDAREHLRAGQSREQCVAAQLASHLFPPTPAVTEYPAILRRMHSLLWRKLCNRKLRKLAESRQGLDQTRV